MKNLAFLILSTTLAASTAFAAAVGPKPILPLSTTWKANPLPLKPKDKTSVDAKIMSDIENARKAAGLNTSGNRTGKATGDWRTPLINATTKAGSLTPAKQAEVFTHAIAIWRKNEKAEEWSNPPVNTKVYGQYRGMKAIQERQALAAYAKGDSKTAVQKYTSLAQGFNGSFEGAAIDLRIIEIQRATFKKTGNHRDYEKVLIATGDKYKDEQVLGTTNTTKAKQVAVMVASLHRILIDQLIKNALAKKAESSVRKATLAAADNYLMTAIGDAEKERIRAAKGEIQYNGGEHVDAAASFASLATENKGAKAKAYWNKAIRSQLILANWTSEAPWDGIADGKTQERETLKGMYGHLTSDSDWYTIAQMGLIDTKLSREADAFKSWTATLAKVPSGNHAQHAAGMMVATYLKAKRWQDAEDLARTMIKANLQGIHRKQNFIGREVLALALLEGGLEKYAANDHKTAVAKLNEFVQGWPNHSRREEGFYHLAMAHQGAGNFKNALETMINFTKTYPKGKYRRDSLVNGGNWSLAMAWEDHVMYFLELHLKEFPKDPQAVNTMESLTNLYMGREYVDAASRIMEIQLASSLIDPITKADIARRLLVLHERQGNREASVSIANTILKRYRDHTDMAASALSLLARMGANSGKTDLSGIERQLAGLNQSDRAVIEAQSEVRFLMSEALANGAFEGEIFSLGSKSPLDDLNKAYNKLERIRLSYEGACSNASAGWCGPALHRLARVYEQFTKTVEPLDISRTLDQPEIKAFVARKSQIMDTVHARALAADQRSFELAKAGATNPDWTGAIVWQNAGDWQSSRVSGETGNGYIQWHAASTQGGH